MSDSIPVIDIGPTLAAGRPVGDVCEQVDRACRVVGFFAISGHAIPDALRDDVLAEARRFFALPDADKLRLGVEHSPNHRGYAGIAGERLQPDLPPDLKETFDTGPEVSPDDPLCSPLEGLNQWPDLPGFRDTIEAYQERALDIAVLLMRVIAEATGLPYDHFDACLARPVATTRLLRYPEASELTDEAQLGCGAHSDYGCLTLLYSDGTPGLQIMNLAGEWIDVEVPAGVLVVNLGDLLQRWTNDIYRSTKHRVIPPVGRERYSVPVFVNPQWGTEVTCLPSCVSDERPARYGPILSGEYLQSRLDDTFIYRATDAA